MSVVAFVPAQWMAVGAWTNGRGLAHYLFKLLIIAAIFIFVEYFGVGRGAVGQQSTAGCWSGRLFHCSLRHFSCSDICGLDDLNYAN